MARAVVLVAALAALVAMVLAADSIEHPFEERFVYGENPFVESNTHWTRSDEAVDPTEMVSFRLYLKQRNLDVLERELLRASDPRSEVYGMCGWLSLRWVCCTAGCQLPLWRHELVRQSSARLALYPLACLALVIVGVGG